MVYLYLIKKRKGQKDRKVKKLKQRFAKNPLKEPQIEWTRKRMDKIKLYHEELTGKPQSGPERKMSENWRKVDSVDDITWNDLEMNEVFLRVNHTNSFMGEQVLYHKLHDVGTDRDWNRVEKQAAYLNQNENVRIELEEKLSNIGKKEEDYHLPTFFMHSELWKIEGGIWLHLLQVLLIVFGIGSILSNNVFWVAGLVGIAMINLMIYLRIKQQYEVFLFALGGLKEIINFSTWMLADESRKSYFSNTEVKNAVEELKKLSKVMVNWQGRKYASMTGDLMAVLNDYLMGITLADIAAFNHMMKLIQNKQDKVLLLYEFAGEIDMLISIVSFRGSVEKWCQPTIWDVQKMQGEQVVHPLLEYAAANDFSLENRAMITGANASGKSTFMKAWAVNVVLAQTIHTCTAEEFCIPKLFVMTSMSLRDDILSGESYYIREVKYLKRMIEQANRPIPTLCVIDEILKGTNTKERLAASAAILEYLVNTNVFVLIATHDMELVHGMKENYEQYYFESQITENDIQFDYQIKKGIGGSSNAIALLALLDFPKEIVMAANGKLGGNGV